MMATAPKQEMETRYRVTMLVPASKVKAVAEQVGGATVEHVVKITPFVPGEWSQAVYDPEIYNESKAGKPNKDEWVNTDGRVIQRHRTYSDIDRHKPWNERKTVPVYYVSDQYGKIGKADDLATAKRIVRGTLADAGMFAVADELAKRVIDSELYGSEEAEMAKDYLAMRRVEHKEQVEAEDPKRRPPQYEVTLLVERSILEKVERDAKAVFGDKLKSVTKVRVNFSRDMELLRAKDHVEQAAEIVGELKDDAESWRDKMPDSLQSTETYNVAEECASSLETLEEELKGINFDEIEFPQMFGG
jgi:hypothetical protein